MEANYYPYVKGTDGYFHLGENTIGTIRSNCLQLGVLFEDHEFPPYPASVFGNNHGRSNIRWKGDIHWKRPVELVPYAQFISEGVSRFDVIQGELGNCWFIAAVANLTLHPGLFSQVVPSDNGTFRPGEYCGAFHFRFWQYGNWVDVIIDDRLPCKRNGELLFLHSNDRREFWSALLEKAYAKLHGSYSSLAGGTPSEALQDFSGGIIEAIDIEPTTTKLFEHMRKAYQRSSLMSCSLSGRSSRYEERTREGLAKGHAYSVTCVDLLPMSNGRSAPLLRIRNPWGDHFEWKGPWSDGSREWTFVHPNVRSAFNVTNRNDGEFWMDIHDFQKHFTRLEICHLSPDPIDSNIKQYGKPWRKEVEYGQWVRGLTAGGCLNYSTFAQNPQYFYHFEASAEDGDPDKCTVIIGLLQKRPKRSTTNEFTKRGKCIGFRMYKTNAYYSSGERLDLSFFKRSKTLTFTSGDFIDSREVSGRFEVPPGNYCIVPSTFEPNEEGEFLLRIFAEPSSNPPPQRFTVSQYAAQHPANSDLIDFRNNGIGASPQPVPPHIPSSIQPNPYSNPVPPAFPTQQPGIVDFPNPYGPQPPNPYAPVQVPPSSYGQPSASSAYPAPPSMPYGIPPLPGSHNFGAAPSTMIPPNSLYPPPIQASTAPSAPISYSANDGRPPPPIGFNFGP